MLLAIVSSLIGAQDAITAVDPPIQLARIEGYRKVAPFWIGKYEVTQKQYAAFIKETKYDGGGFPSTKPTETFLMDWVRGRPPAGKENFPVCYVNRNHAAAFCAWLAEKSGRPVRLPNEAQWSLAARGMEGRAYPWGNAWDPKRCNWGDDGKVDGFKEAAPIGSFPLGATPEGVHDLAGNIWEWSQEGHLRGGPWCMGPETVRAETIAEEDPGRCDDKFGFRVVVPIRNP